MASVYWFQFDEIKPVCQQSAVSLPLFPPHLCFFWCNPACRPHRPSALLDVWELGRHRALRSGRDGWKNVCESDSCVRMTGCGGW